MKYYNLFPNFKQWNDFAIAFLLHTAFTCAATIGEGDVFASRYDTVLHQFFADKSKSPADYTGADVVAFLDSPASGNRGRADSGNNKPPSKGTRYNRLQALSKFYDYAASMFTMVEGEQQRLLTVKPPTDGITLSEHPHKETHHLVRTIRTLNAVRE
jgi:hypothetical protein